MTLDDLGGRLFASVPEAAAILRRDPRTIRRAAGEGEIPARRVGTRWMIQTQWIRAEAGLTADSMSAGVDYDRLAELVNRRANQQLAVVFAQLATVFSAASEAV